MIFDISSQSFSHEMCFDLDLLKTELSERFHPHTFVERLQEDPNHALDDRFLLERYFFALLGVFVEQS